MIAPLGLAGAVPHAIELVGGLSLFLFGLEMLAATLKAVAGNRMRSILGRLTGRRLAGVATGCLVTGLVQSSSVTTVLLISFVSAGLLSVSQSVGVILGANIGTTITAQLIAFQLSGYALLLVAAGYGVSLVARRETWKQQGRALLCIGLIFFGMHVMGLAMEPLRGNASFQRWIAEMANPLLGILAGAAFTAVVQSSAATTGVVIVLAGQGLLGLEAGIALIFGANIGTCATALLASIGRPREALRVAMVHVLIKVAGVALWFPFLDELAALVRMLAEDDARRIAHAHTIFNVATSAIFLPLAGGVTRVAELLVRDRPLAEEQMVRAKYLDESLIATPALALDRARLEILHMGDTAREMLRRILPALTAGSEADLAAIEVLDDRVDTLHGYIVTYLGRISRGQLSEAQTAEFLRLMEAANSLENIGDIVEVNLVQLGRARLAQQLRISASTLAVLREFHAAVTRSLEGALVAVTQKNPEAARAVMDMKAEINRLADSAALHEARRLVAEEPNRLPAYTLEIDTLENLKRVFYFCRRMARAGIPDESGRG